MAAHTVNSLIEELQELQDAGKGELPVGFAYDYGDHCHSIIVEDVSEVEERGIKWSDYHRANKLLKESDEQDDPLPQKPDHTYIVLR